MTAETQTCDLCGREIGRDDDGLRLTVKDKFGGLSLNYLRPSGMPNAIRVPHDGNGNLDLCFACKRELEDTLYKLMAGKGSGNGGPRVRRLSGARLKVYEGFGPSGRMETMAVSARKAKSNLRYRLHVECGLSRHAAAKYDLSPLREVVR